MSRSSDGIVRGLGIGALLGTVPLLWGALAALGERDYVSGALLVFAAAAIGHLGLELVALGSRGEPAAAEDDG